MMKGKSVPCYNLTLLYSLERKVFAHGYTSNHIKKR
jgi:hypothetical protein